MLTSRRNRQGGHGPPLKPGWTGGRRLAVVVLALAALGLEGCSTWNGGRCGGCGGLFRTGRLSRLFRRDVIVTDPCGPPAVAVPAPVITAPGAIVPAPAPAGEPAELTPIGPAPEAAAPTRHSALSPNRRTVYETVAPPAGMVTSRPEDPSRSKSAPAAARGLGTDDPLAELPPLSAVVSPAESDTPPVPPAAESLPTGSLPRELPPRANPEPLSLTEGIARFKVVKPQVAGGSAPTAPGWTFLVEKGYRTVLDLRPISEAQAGDVAAANRAGLSYVLLTVTPETLDDRLFEQFREFLVQTGNKPLYFFDTDGTRAAVLWYVYQVAIEQVDEATAAREVEELGPRTGPLWLAATAYLERRKPAAPASSRPPQPASVSEDPPADEPAVVPAPAPVGPTALVPTAAAVPAHDPVPAPGSDPTAWRPYAALFVTGLSVPLALLGRSALNQFAHRRASLPATAPAPRSLPDGSGG